LNSCWLQASTKQKSKPPKPSQSHPAQNRSLSKTTKASPSLGNRPRPEKKNMHSASQSALPKSNLSKEGRRQHGNELKKENRKVHPIGLILLRPKLRLILSKRSKRNTTGSPKQNSLCVCMLTKRGVVQFYLHDQSHATKDKTQPRIVSKTPKDTVQCNGKATMAGSRSCVGLIFPSRVLSGCRQSNVY